MKVLDDPKLFFWLRSGKSLKSVEDLMHYLPETQGAEFHYHVNDEKNDFATWIQDVFDDEELANAIRDARTASDMLVLLTSYYGEDQVTRQAARQTKGLAKEHADSDSIAPGVFTSVHIPEPEPLVDDVPVPAHEGELDADKIADENDVIADRFDQATKRIEEKMNPPVPDSLTKRVEVLNEKERDLRQRISESRKAGHDPFMAYVVLMRFKSRLELARVTREETDFALVEETLADAEKELAEANEQPPLDVKKEIEKMAAPIIGGKT